VAPALTAPPVSGKVTPAQWTLPVRDGKADGDGI
jgi:hypothetical protein